MSDNPWNFYKDTAITFEPVAGQLSAMWRMYGRRESQRCGMCVHLYKRRGNTNFYFKCDLYRDTRGAATDWRKKWIACGKWEGAKDVNDRI